MLQTHTPKVATVSIPQILKSELYTYVQGEKVCGRGMKFVKSHQGRPIYFADLKKLRETGEAIAAHGGRSQLNETFSDLIDLCVCVGSNWDGIAGFYK